MGLTKATCDHAWIAELFVRALKEQCSDAELSATYVSVNTITTSREIHIDSNNLTDTESCLPSCNAISRR